VARRTISTTFQLSLDDEARLRLLAARTQRTVDDCLQEAVALVLERHRERLPEQLAMSVSPSPADR
jgi:predicted DNA-binding protein